MDPHDLPLPAGYAPEGAAAVALLAAGLDEQLRVLEKRLAGADVAALEWQLRPGTNTAGMLLAHLAIVEAYWLQAVVRGLTEDAAADRAVRAAIGIGMADDGMPVAADGGHPATLRGWGLADYLALLHRARAGSHEVLRAWRDDDLARTLESDGRPVSRAWVLFHVLDHFSHHAGQIALIRSLRSLRETSPA